MPAFEGLILLRRYISANADMNAESAIKAILAAEVDAKTLDLDASLVMHGLVPEGIPLGGVVFYRSCIKAVVIHKQPIWAKSMTSG